MELAIAEKPVASEPTGAPPSRARAMTIDPSLIRPRPPGVTPGGYRVYEAILSFGSGTDRRIRCTAVELAAAMNLNMGHIRKYLPELERSGLFVRARDDNKFRIFLLPDPADRPSTQAPMPIETARAPKRRGIPVLKTTAPEPKPEPIREAIAPERVDQVELPQRTEEPRPVLLLRHGDRMLNFAHIEWFTTTGEETALHLASGKVVTVPTLAFVRFMSRHMDAKRVVIDDIR
jgi:hypothetical protein